MRVGVIFSDLEDSVPLFYGEVARESFHLRAQELKPSPGQEVISILPRYRSVTISQALTPNFCCLGGC